MLNIKNLFKNIYGDILVARKVVMQRAMKLKKMGLDSSSALKKAWAEAKEIVLGIVRKLQSYKLHINNQTFELKGSDAEDIVDLCLEKIEEVKGKKFAYNVINNLTERWDRAITMFQERGTLTFAQDVFIRKSMLGRI